MKKKLISFISFLTAATLFVFGCDAGKYIDNGGTKRPDTTVKPDDNPGNPGTPDVDENHYKASVYFGGELFLPGETDINVVWRNDIQIVRVPLGADGRADAGELDGDYYVYLEGLPSEYVYDANEYIATADEPQVSINLETLKLPVSGNGEGLYSNMGCYMLQYDGIYRATVKGEFTRVYYDYKPTASGYYSIEAKVNVFYDEINPVIDIYSGNAQFKVFIRTIDDGGSFLDGGYTKNFRYEVHVDKNEIGNSFSFAIGAQSRTKNYPVDVDFRIKYEGEYSSGYTDIRIKRADEAYFTALPPNPGERFYFADTCPRTAADAAEYAAKTGKDIRNAKIFDANYFKYNPNTGFYHYYNEELYGDNSLGYGAGFGPFLACAITKVIPCYEVTTLYRANHVGLGQNFLKLTNVWIEEEQKYATFDYTDFIRTDYYRVCNNDGVCYVTRELKEFLQIFAEHHGLYKDGISEPVSDSAINEGYVRTPEELGYSANQDALWLFACGFYM